LSAGVASRKVLIVEDDDSTREMLRTALSSDGARVSTAERGTEALALFWSAVDEGDPFALILLDCALPRLDGWSVCASIRRAEGMVEGLKRAEVLGYTAYGDKAERFVAEEDVAHFDRVYRKPADTRELLEMLKGE